MYVLVLVVIIGVLLSLWYWTRNYPRSPPIYPGGLPIIGHPHIIIKYRKDLWGFLQRIADYSLENRGIVQLWAGPVTAYVVSDPEVVGNIANTCLDKPFFYNFLIDSIGNGLVTLNEPTWRIHNKLLSPSFNQQVINTFLPEINVQARNMVAQMTTVAGKGPVDIKEFITQYILRSVCHLWGFLQRIADYSLENRGIVQLWAGPVTAYVVSDPEVVGNIANTCLDKPFFYNFLIDSIGNGLVTLNEPTWRIHNKLLSPSFNQQVINTFLPEINVQARNMVAQMTTVAGKGPVDIKEFITQYILRSVCRTSLGLESKDQDIIDNGYATALEEILRIVCYRALNVYVHPSCIYNWTSMRRRELELVKIVKNMINPIIQKRKSELKPTKLYNNYNSTTVSGKFKPTLDLMLDLSNEQNVLSDDEIRAHLNTFVAASYDTTSAVLHNALMALGSYPDVQERVYEEVQDVFQNNEELTKHDISKLIYLEAVIKEVLRVYVAVPLVARKVDADIVLPKYTLRAGSICVLSIYGLNRHPSWGPDAKEFKPERWLNPATLPTNPNVYAAFSFGKRNCIGKQYAMMSLKTSIAHVVRKFRITADINILKWRYEIVLKPTTTPLVNLTLRS